MTNRINNIERYQFNSNDAVLFDANIWLYLYSPQGDLVPKLKATYNDAFNRIRSVQCPIFLDVLVLSEFINAYARFMYNRLPPTTKPPDFKTFRNSDDFQPIAREISKYSRRIVSKCQRIESGFESVNLSSLLTEYGAGKSDFNDQILAGLCRDRGLKLITHDGDFQAENLTVITANSKLLSQAKN